MIQWSRISRNPLFYGLAAIALILLITSTFHVVPETKQGVVLRFGEPVRTINRYKTGEVFGRTGAGLVMVIPGFEQVVWIDKRVRDVDMERQQVLSTDQLRLNIDAFARFRIVDPLRMIQTVGSEDRVAEALARILGSRLRNELGKQPFAALLSPERTTLMEDIQQSVNRQARQYGAEIVDVRIKRADLPTGAPLESAYSRMRSARDQEALNIRAQGDKQAQLIRASADATAAEVYANSFGKDADFYAFYRAMEAYRKTFKDSSSSMVLSTDNEFMREFEGRRTPR